MSVKIDALLKKGFTPLAANSFAAISWQGEPLADFWMWNGQVSQGPQGTFIQTVKVLDLKEAAVRLWRDGWVPLRWDSALLRRMEAALRAHRGLKAQGAVFPDGQFLKEPARIPDEYLDERLKVLLLGGER